MSEDRQPSGTTTDFGFTRVGIEEKAQRVAEVFTAVAPRYDLMNDILSLGSHRLFKRFMLDVSAVRPGQRIVDLACGTGDMSLLLAEEAGAGHEILLVDINPAMLVAARDRLLDAGIAKVRFVVADAECLPIPDDSVDLVIMAFGLRNVTCKERALADIVRVLRPGGRCVVLEFSRPPGFLWRQAFDFYTSLWPLVGQVVTRNADAYRYLTESIRLHPEPDALALMFTDAGFSSVRYRRLMGGIVALHWGIKLYS